MPAVVVSPELVLVDPELREAALLSLPRFEPFDFLRFSDRPRRHPDLDLFAFLAESDETETSQRTPAVWVGALAHAGSALAKTLLVDLLIVLCIAAAVALTQVG